MRKLLILGIVILFTSPTFGQYDNYIKTLEREKKDYRFSAWSSLSISVFSYGVGSAGFINPWSDPDTKSHVLMMGTIGLGFNILAITKFVMARRTQKRIDKFKFDHNPYRLDRYKPVEWNY